MSKKIVTFIESMKAEDIKTELKDLIDQESDLHLLESIKSLLKKDKLNPTLKEKLTSRALKSEQDIKEGRVHTREEAEKILRSRLGI
jgi:hypothetical protein